MQKYVFASSFMLQHRRMHFVSERLEAVISVLTGAYTSTITCSDRSYTLRQVDITRVLGDFCGSTSSNQHSFFHTELQTDDIASEFSIGRLRVFAESSTKRSKEAFAGMVGLGCDPTGLRGLPARNCTGIMKDYNC